MFQIFFSFEKMEIKACVHKIDSAVKQSKILTLTIMSGPEKVLRRSRNRKIDKSISKGVSKEATSEQKRRKMLAKR